MNSITNPYDALYTNLKNRFTVIHDGRECTVGDFMLMKAGKRRSTESSLPVAKVSGEQKSLTTIINYVNEKLTVKNPPVKDKTMRRFPIRTSASAMLSAVAACALVISCGIFAISGINDATLPMTAENTSDVSEYENEVEENELTDYVTEEK